MIVKKRKNSAFTKTTVNRVKDEILGKDYDLSFSFISKSKIQELNKKYRKKDEPTDILSFPYDNPSTSSGQEGSGEILICKQIAKKKAPNYNLTSKNYLLFLLIHGLLHLKGLRHGQKMKKLEKKYFQKFKQKNTPN